MRWLWRRGRACWQMRRCERLLEELAGWPGTVISSHKSAGQPFHKLTFLADLGLRASDAQVAPLVTAILAYQAAEGPFLLPANISTSYGGTGEETWGWALCDAPLIVYALVRFGLGEMPEVQRAIQYLTGLFRRDNGWPCAVSAALGGFSRAGTQGGSLPVCESCDAQAAGYAGRSTPARRRRGWVSRRCWNCGVRA